MEWTSTPKEQTIPNIMRKYGFPSKNRSQEVSYEITKM